MINGGLFEKHWFQRFWNILPMFLKSALETLLMKNFEDLSLSQMLDGTFDGGNISR